MREWLNQNAWNRVIPFDRASRYIISERKN
ncbi:hypothetical protein RHECNPAF_1740027 [Rhizobium etli CNPAF512]|nr:hypothetical protein RHECNPAF_1740027 [Rhizobium etli CNPAF512]